MSEKNFDIYLEFDYSKLNIAAFSKFNHKLEYYKQQSYDSYFNNDKELKFDELHELVEDNILEIEKTTTEFVKEIFLMIETPQSYSIKLSVMKNNEGKKIIKQDAMYLIQDAKQQLLKLNNDVVIIHIIVENYVLDNVEYKFLPLDINCKKFSADIKFICFPKDLIKNFEKLFLKQQIFINKFICSKYVKTFDFKNIEKNICQRGKDIVEGINKQEVVSIPKTIKKTGFFEKLFHLFR
jgi:hypothetical protein